ncbi:MAG: hypothetical protein ACREVE_05860 [Gammaproteobacteria bacterium]
MSRVRSCCDPVKLFLGKPFLLVIAYGALGALFVILCVRELARLA